MAVHGWTKHGLSLFLVCGLHACAKETTPPQSAVSRAYDRLANAVLSCASAHARCDEDDGGSSCTRSFTDCRESAGRESERELVTELSACLERSQSCTREAEEAGDAGEPERCSGALRACIGESRLPYATRTHGDASPDSEAPTFQCFGELRECVTTDEAPKECSAATRDCLIRAVGDPAPSDPSPRPIDAGKPIGADAGTPPRAGTGAPAPSPEAGRGSEPPAAGAGAQPPIDGGADPDVTSDCMARRDECLAKGGKPMQCARDLRKCGKAR